MSNYVDRFGRYHDKPIKSTEAFSSNNGYCYTATAKLLHIPLDVKSIKTCYQLSKTSTGFNRHPRVRFPPTSRDEVQGALILGLLPPQELIDKNYYFCNLSLPKSANLLTKVVKLLSLIGKHRNAVWNTPEVWGIAFTLPPQDKWFVQKLAGKTTSKLLDLYFNISSRLTLRKNNPSGVILLWQKLEALNMKDSPLYKRINIKEQLNKYFPEGHPFRTLSK
jgi:hypothetical protein